MDITKISNKLGWEPRESLVSGLEKTVNWYLDNEDWVKRIVEEKNYQEWMDLNYTGRGEQA
jgi:dTDP-glucose 4,6-dehydratase